MDHRSFDQIAAALGGAATRRAGLRAAFGALVGLGAAGASARDRNRDRDRDRGKDADRSGSGSGDGPRPEGPCKSTKRPDNICTKDKQCCTGWCDTSKGKKNKDGKGRCRYLKEGMTCKKGQQCAKRLECRDGVCARKQGAAVPTGERCEAGATCAVADAVCTAYTGQGAPGGTFCTLPLGATCTGDPECTCYSCGTPNPETGNLRRRAARAGLACCGKDGIACTKDSNCCTGWTCQNGTCTAVQAIPTGEACTQSDVCADSNASCTTYATNDPAGTFCLLADETACTAATECESKWCRLEMCEPRVECDVCPTCDYQTVQAAIDALQGAATMETVYIDEGDYTEDLTLDGKIELAACNGAAVTLRNATATSSRYRTIVLDWFRVSAPELVLTDITVTSGGQGGGIGGAGSVTLNGTTTITGCDSSSYDSYGGGGIHLGTESVLVMNDSSSITTNVAAGNGGGVRLDSYSSCTMNDFALVSGNTVPGNGGGVSVAYKGAFTMNGDTVVSGNTADSYAGGVNVDSYSTIVLNDRATIKDNDGYYGGGLFVSYHTTTTLNHDVVVSGNTAKGYGAGVLVYENSTLTMNGNATISGNKAIDGGSGGGIHVYANADIVMNDSSKVIANEADSYGGGVSITDGTLELNDSSEVSGNIAGAYGGGVRLHGTRPGSRPSLLTVNGTAKISNNVSRMSDFDATSGSGGGGVFLGYAGKLVMNGGEISGNSVKPDGTNVGGYGGGVSSGGPTGNSVSISTYWIEMNGGTITGNQAGTGGGIYLRSDHPTTGGVYSYQNKMQMTGGTITGNTATVRGGGLAIEWGYLNLVGGSISGNTSPMGSNVNGVTSNADGTGDLGQNTTNAIVFENKIDVISPGVLDNADVTCRGYFPLGTYGNSASSPHCVAIT